MIDLSDEEEMREVLEGKTDRKKKYGKELYESLPGGMVRSVKYFWTRKVFEEILGGSDTGLEGFLGILGGPGSFMEMVDEMEEGHSFDEGYGLRVSDDRSEYLALEDFVERYDSFLYGSESFEEFRDALESSEVTENTDYWDGSFPGWDECLWELSADGSSGFGGITRSQRRIYDKLKDFWD